MNLGRRNLKKKCLKNPRYSLWALKNERDLPGVEGNTTGMTEESLREETENDLRHEWKESYDNRTQAEEEKVG